MSIIKKMRFWVSSNIKNATVWLRIKSKQAVSIIKKKWIRFCYIKNTVRLYIEHNQNRAKTEYTDLAPINKIGNGAEYLNALHWALNNKKIKNIALAGPYGSGKSSIIETYLNSHKTVRKKALRISMATFVANVVEQKGEFKKIGVTPNEIELGILKQLFYKVDYKKIPQSRYRKIHKISFWDIFACLLGLSGVISIIVYVFFTETFNSIIEKVIKAGSPIASLSKLSYISPAVISLILFGILVLGVLAVLSFMYRSIASRFKVKEIKLPADTTVTNGEETNETIFNKYMDEIVYFFEETKYQFVFFEDLDRLDHSSVFVHLRELNTLLNNCDVIKKPIVFVYAIKDDIFLDTDRTKFFEFIIPVIPIINSTNSGEILLEKLENSKRIGIEHKISQGFVLDVSPYISDMRVLLNTYNEFIVYKKTLREEQDLKLLDEPMMALIIFKNLYPCDFAEIQMEQGIIKQAFFDKQKYLNSKQSTIQGEIDELSRLLTQLPSETLKNIKELKSTFLCEITSWRGYAYEMNSYGHFSTRASQFMQDDFSISQWKNIQQCSGSFRTWDGNSGNSFSCEQFSEICSTYLDREKMIRIIEKNQIAEIQKKIENYKEKLHDISGWSLKQLIEQFGFEEILSYEVKQNKLLVFLLRRGYIDEKYANYINYFKGNTVTKGDMNFILSVKNMEPQPFAYPLIKTPMVIQRLQEYEFKLKPIYNFDLLECLLSSDSSFEKLNTFISQVVDEEELSWNFIDDFIDKTTYRNQSRFIKLLASAWPNMWDYITQNVVLTYERKIYYLELLILNNDIEVLIAMNSNNKLSDFFENNEDILEKLNSIESCRIIGLIKAIQLKFSNVSIENVQTDVLDYIFDNNCYELNKLMIQHVVKYKNEDLVPYLDSRHYTTIIKLDYAQLIDYVRENLTHYLETIVLTGELANDEEEQIFDLLERSIDDQALCNKIIKHENFCIDDITRCCKALLAENKSAVKVIWDLLLENEKILPVWKNVSGYWSEFELSQYLIDYIEKHVDDLVHADSHCIKDDFIRKFIQANVASEVFAVLLPYIRMNNFDIALNTLDVEKLIVMINCQYFNFTIEYYEEISRSFPDLRVEFILKNQTEYIDVINDIQLDSSLMEGLLFSDRLNNQTAQMLIDNFGARYMTVRIATNLSVLGLEVDLEIFKAAWGCLGESDKQKLMLNNLSLLDADSLYSCFTDLGINYSDFLDRSKQRTVELLDTLENRKLAERLLEVKYITSYKPNVKKTVEANRVTAVITCRIKAIR